MNTTNSEQILIKEGISIEELVTTAYNEIAKMYYDYPKIRSEFEIGDLINEVLLYFLQDRKDGTRRLEYYLEGGKAYFMNMFRQACRQEIPAYTRYNFIKHQALSLNTPMKDDTETEYIDTVSNSSNDEEEQDFKENLDVIFTMLYEKPKNNYLLKKKQEHPEMSELELMLNVYTRIELCKIRERAELEKKIINLLNEGYKMSEIKRMLDCSDINENMNDIKEVFTEYYQAR